MSRKFNHFDSIKRIRLYELLHSSLTIPRIANILGFHKSSIYRELERNCHTEGYRPDWANNTSRWRRFNLKISKIDRNQALKSHIIEKLKAGWSPQLIDGRLRMENGGKCIVSFETIYRYIYSESGRLLKLYKLLKEKRRYRFPRIKRRRYSTRKAKPNISERSELINNRNEFGHWEGDLIVFTKLKNNVITLRERKSRYIEAIKNQSRKSAVTINALVRHMKNAAIKTLTLDNDPAFARYMELQDRLNISVYFCDPYKSYQKGAIENANRLLRENLPRKTNISKVTQDELNGITHTYNNRPMKCLGYKTPFEVYNEHLDEIT